MRALFVAEHVRSSRDVASYRRQSPRSFDSFEVPDVERWVTRGPRSARGHREDRPGAPSGGPTDRLRAAAWAFTWTVAPPAAFSPWLTLLWPQSSAWWRPRVSATAG